MKRLASAVLVAFLGLMGSMNVDAATVDDDYDDDSGVELLDSAPRPPRPLDGRVLALASSAVGEPIDRAWVVRGVHGTTAAAAVQRRTDDVAVVTVAVAPAGPPTVQLAATLLRGALSHCRNSGALKVIVDAEGMPPADVKSVAAAHGFQFAASRQGKVFDADALEFYTDLYWRERPL